VIEETDEDDGFVIGNDDGGGKEKVQNSDGWSFQRRGAVCFLSKRRF